MGKFAAATVVPIERSRAEIEETLRKYGASEFHSGWNASSAMIGFRIGGLFIRFVLPLPATTEERFAYAYDKRTRQKRRRSEQAAYKEWDQEIRQRWRALLLVIKAKLEAVECQISTLESEFLAFIVLPNDRTIGDWLIEDALPAIRAGEMPKLGMRPAASPADVIDAEVEETGMSSTPSHP